jgi:hypothetical protein
MASAWQTLEEAALTLGISSRTLHRRLARGEFETRLENGRREVLVVIDEPLAPIEIPAAQSMADAVADMSVTDEPSVSDIPPMSDEPSATSDSTPGELSDEIQTTMLALHEDRIRRTDLAIMAYQQSVNVTAADARRAHRNLRIAWGVAGATAAVSFVAIVWATHSVTRANAQVDHLSGVVRQLSDTADTRQREVERWRNDAQEARVAAARIEGELSAAKTQATASAASPVPATQPASATTQPVSVMQRLMDRVTMR